MVLRSYVAVIRSCRNPSLRLSMLGCWPEAPFLPTEQARIELPPTGRLSSEKRRRGSGTPHLGRNRLPLRRLRLLRRDRRSGRRRCQESPRLGCGLRLDGFRGPRISSLGFSTTTRCQEQTCSEQARQYARFHLHLFRLRAGLFLLCRSDHCSQLGQTGFQISVRRLQPADGTFGQ